MGVQAIPAGCGSEVEYTVSFLQDRGLVVELLKFEHGSRSITERE